MIVLATINVPLHIHPNLVLLPGVTQTRYALSSQQLKLKSTDIHWGLILFEELYLRLKFRVNKTESIKELMVR